jgi:XRE family aerobic/anaerobic benzoate catabolism transcriptional regulator
MVRTSTISPDPASSGTGRRKAATQPEAHDAAFLAVLGERVREARARRGMSRKGLARDSGVSERYLAQLESGEGNASVLLLRQIAGALNLPLTDLLREPDGNPPELALTMQLLQRLTPAQLTLARQELMHRFAGSSPARRRQRIALIGLRGAGKSTLGARLAKELDAPFVELDREIEREAGTSLSEIFLLYGQAGYRRYERRALEKTLEQHERCVIAAGGSVVSEPATYELLLSACHTVWLRARPEEHMARVVAQGDTRPMAGNTQAMDDLRRILDARAGLYGQADAVVDTAGRSVEQSLRDLKKSLRAAPARSHAAENPRHPRPAADPSS